MSATSLRMAVALSVLGLSAPTAHAGGATDEALEVRTIDEAEPWAQVVTGEQSKSLFERRYGAEAEAARQAFQPFMQDGVLYDRDSGAADMYRQLGVPPLHAENYEPTVGVLYVETGGVTLNPTCGNGESANAAKNCTPLVDSTITFPAIGGGAGAGLFQELQSYYEPFNLVMTQNRPPDYLPYTMAVVGGSAQLAGFSGACGVANVACDGLKRNHVSLTFPESCGGSANTAAQETAHNWGLEHTDNAGDLMYPFNMGGFQQFVDSCMTISHATGDGNTQCGYVHEVYCPAGKGEVQNSYGELMGVFGPRAVDSVEPEVVSVFPENGAVFSTSDTVLVTAEIDDDSRMVGVKWTWEEGLPEGTDSYTKCTNKVCDEDFVTGASFDPSEIAWDFVNLQEPPVGVYSFKVEVLDAYGNYDSRTITFEVTEDGSEGGADASADESGGGSGGGTGDDGTGGSGADGASGIGTGGFDGGLDGGDDGDPEGCGCRSSGDTPPALPWSGMLAVFGLLFVGRGRRPLR